MENFKAIWEYQNAELKFEEFEQTLKNTETRRKLVKQQQLFNANQQQLKQYEQEIMVMQNKLAETALQTDTLTKQMRQKDEEIKEIEGYDLEDLFIEDVKEGVKESENIKSALEINKRKVVDILHKLEGFETEIKETLVKMSNAKKLFDQLKITHNGEIEAGREDMEKLKKVIDAAAKTVDAKTMELYKKIKQHRQNPIAVLNGDRCSGCKMQLPSNVLSRVKANTEAVICENCGRVLILLDK